METQDNVTYILVEGLVEKIHAKLSQLGLSPRNKYSVDKMKYWLEKYKDALETMYTASTLVMTGTGKILPRNIADKKKVSYIVIYPGYKLEDYLYPYQGGVRIRSKEYTKKKIYFECTQSADTLKQAQRAEIQKEKAEEETRLAKEKAEEEARLAKKKAEEEKASLTKVYIQKNTIVYESGKEKTFPCELATEKALHKYISDRLPTIEDVCRGLNYTKLADLPEPAKTASMPIHNGRFIARRFIRETGMEELEPLVYDNMDVFTERILSTYPVEFSNWVFNGGEEQAAPAEARQRRLEEAEEIRQENLTPEERAEENRLLRIAYLISYTVTYHDGTKFTYPYEVYTEKALNDMICDAYPTVQAVLNNITRWKSRDVFAKYELPNTPFNKYVKVDNADYVFDMYYNSKDFDDYEGRTVYLEVNEDNYFLKEHGEDFCLWLLEDGEGIAAPERAVFNMERAAKEAELAIEENNREEIEERARVVAIEREKREAEEKERREAIMSAERERLGSKEALTKAYIIDYSTSYTDGNTETFPSCVYTEQKLISLISEKNPSVQDVLNDMTKSPSSSVRAEVTLPNPAKNTHMEIHNRRFIARRFVSATGVEPIEPLNYKRMSDFSAKIVDKYAPEFCLWVLNGGEEKVAPQEVRQRELEQEEEKIREEMTPEERAEERELLTKAYLIAKKITYGDGSDMTLLDSVYTEKALTDRISSRFPTIQDVLDDIIWVDGWYVRGVYDLRYPAEEPYKKVHNYDYIFDMFVRDTDKDVEGRRTKYLDAGADNYLLNACGSEFCEWLLANGEDIASPEAAFEREKSREIENELAIEKSAAARRIEEEDRKREEKQAREERELKAREEEDRKLKEEMLKLKEEASKIQEERERTVREETVKKLKAEEARKLEEERERIAREEETRKRKDETRKAKEEARKAKEEARKMKEEQARKRKDEARKAREEEDRKRKEGEARKRKEEEEAKKAREEKVKKAREEARRMKEEAQKMKEEEVRKAREEEARKAKEETALGRVKKAWRNLFTRKF